MILSIYRVELLNSWREIGNKGEKIEDEWNKALKKKKYQRFKMNINGY